MEQGYTVDPSAADKSDKPQSEWRDIATFVLKLALIVFVVRSFIFSPFSIPSESMLPRLLIGDYLFITKFNYGYSKHSLPFSLPLLPDMHWSDPTPGDVVVFKAPPFNSDDWIKRVIGRPGDTVQMKGGVLILNGKAIPKQQIADFLVPITPNFPAEKCLRGVGEGVPRLDDDGKGHQSCRIRRFRETLPNGKTYEVLDQGDYSRADDTDLFTVPAGHLFLMGDNRDDSQDSRFPQDPLHKEQSGIRFVPMENIEGKAVVGFWSTDGSASWLLPWTWFTAARWSRIGEGF